jgi:toxin ParE1/3/4
MRSSRNLEFTPEADEDLRLLLADSFANWGEVQQAAYAERLSIAMGQILSHPHLGRSRDDLQPELRSLLAGHHLIYYLVDERTITVIRILHAKMDPARHLHQAE